MLGAPFRGFVGALVAWVLAAGYLSAEDRYITLNNQPLGTPEKPLVLRTYFPDPGLGREVLPNFALGERARKYRPGKGDIDGFEDPIRGIPSAIGVNFGPALSYCWDTTECRLLYAWQGGFLDMKNYWGSPESGHRKSFGYIPELTGPIIYLTEGTHPLAILDDFTARHVPHYKAMRLIQGVPEFEYQLGPADIRVRITPGRMPMSIDKHYLITGVKKADYKESGYKAKLDRQSDLEFTVTIQGMPSTGGKRPELPPDYKTDKPNVEWGQALYTELGCFACHSTDGTRGHGPTFSGLFGSSRKITGLDQPVTADAAYLRESIKTPTAKVVDGFPVGFMPLYPLEDKQIESLVLYLQTLTFE